ncbi:MAG: hypothetical protein LQ337_003062 [Flavoplaca oasis]|nr:MAG: hypothetical protein LQ337_003062 [Flavoplaca oasis]
MGDENALLHFRKRFDDWKSSESQRQSLIQIGQDLAIEKDARRQLQTRIKDELEPLMFRDDFLNKNEVGGRLAADELLAQVNHYIKGLNLDVENTDVVVRAYANLRGLGKACVRNNSMKSTADLGLVANGFTSRYPLFDFVDVGLGNERADHKIQVSPAIRSLGLKRKVRFPSVFAPGWTPIAQNSGDQAQIPTPVTASRVIKAPFQCSAVDATRLGPIMKNEQGKRIDKYLKVDSGAVQALTEKNLCTWLFLKGFCAGCERNHAHRPLNEQDIKVFRRNRRIVHALLRALLFHSSIPDHDGQSILSTHMTLRLIRSEKTTTIRE